MGQSKYKRYILIMIDSFSRFAKERICQQPTSSAAMILHKKWTTKFGTPKYTVYR